MTRRMLVTGAAGLLGRTFSSRWRGPGKLIKTARNGRPGIAGADLSQRADCRRLVEKARPDIVFHLAGRNGMAPLNELWRDHVTATLNLLEALRARGKKVRVVLAGSSAEYGPPTRPDGAVRESDPANPINPYGSSKLAQTHAALSFTHYGIEVVVARIFNVVGAGMPASLALGAFAAQIAAIEAGRQPPVLNVGNLDSARDYVDVRDAADALAALARRGRSGEIYNVSAGRAFPMRTLLDQMLRQARRPVRVRRDPRRMRRAEVSRVSGNHEKLRRHTGWRAKIPLAASIQETLQWHRAS